MMGWRTWNDRLSLFLLMGIPGLWVLHTLRPMPEAILGATISVWTMVAMFYFRKGPPPPPT